MPMFCMRMLLKPSSSKLIKFEGEGYLFYVRGSLPSLTGSQLTIGSPKALVIVITLYVESLGLT